MWDLKNTDSYFDLYRFLYLSFDILVLCIISTLTQMGLSQK